MRLYRYNLKDGVETPRCRMESTAPYRSFALLARDMRRMEATEGDRLDLFSDAGRIMIAWDYRMDYGAGYCRWIRTPVA